MFKKNKRTFDERIKQRSKLGFSLVELIVVIAIMAILTAILVPTMLQYVEKTRAAKDNSAMGEVTNAVKIAMADQDVYDELLMVESGKDAKVPSGYATTEDETAAAFAGEQRGVIITFRPEANNKQSVIKLADGIINGAATGDTDITDGDGKLGDLTAGDGENHLINVLINICGEEITLTSQTYRNSDYTIFIKIGTTGGVDVSITVNGEWNGTNLPSDGSTSGGEGGPGGGTHTHVDTDNNNICDDENCKATIDPNIGGGESVGYAAEFNQNESWSDVIAACQAAASGDDDAIAAIENWNLGDSLMMTIDNVEYEVMIIGKNHDNYADDSGKAPLTFQLKNCYTQFYVDKTRTNQNGWSGSTMRTTTLANILAAMPAEVKSAIKPVNKKTIEGGGKNSINPTNLEYTEDTLFLLSESEVFGTTQWYSSGIDEGERYEFYKNGGSTSKTCYGSISDWWLRSPSYKDSDTFMLVYSNGGNLRSGNAGSASGVAFGFCF